MTSSTTAMDLTSLEKDPRLFLYTSLTAGSSHIITATSRMETILKANQIPFVAIDTATDEKARRLWQRRAGKRKLPGLVREGYVVGDLQEIEDWNEYGELKENIGPVPASTAAPAQGGQAGVQIAPKLPVVPTATVGTAKVAPKVDREDAQPVALPGAAEIKARGLKSGGKEEMIDAPPKAETMSSASVEKEESIETAKKEADPKAVEHLSVPASRIGSGTATPAVDSKEEEVKEDSSAVKATHPAIEHLSAPASRLQSGTASPTESAEAKEAEGDESAEVVKGVEGLQVGEGIKTQEQDAKEPEDAGKSVED